MAKKKPNLGQAIDNFFSDHVEAIKQEQKDRKKINEQNDNFGDRFVNQLKYGLTPSNTPMAITIKAARKNRLASTASKAAGLDPLAKIFDTIGFGNESFVAPKTPQYIPFKPPVRRGPLLPPVIQSQPSLPTQTIAELFSKSKPREPVKYYARGGSRIKL